MWNRVLKSAIVGIALISPLLSGNAQQVSREITPPAASARTSVPALVPYSGVVIAESGKPLVGDVSITFLIFKDEQGGEPLFTETQSVAFDEAGRYRVQLGASNPNGLPSDLFSSGEARWLEVQIAGQQPQPRVLLASVPYALKAADAATLGGLPVSAFALAGSNTVAAVGSAAITPDAASTVTTTGGTANKVAKFSGSNTIVNSILYDNGTEVGVGTTSPTATLTVNGTFTVDGGSTFNNYLLLSPAGTATSSKAYNSQLIKLYASAYNSSTKAAVSPHFEWQVEPTGNNTAMPNGTLNLLATSGASGIAETGLYLNTNGTIHFASGQTFGATSSSGVAFNGTSTSNTGVEGTSSSGSGEVGDTAGTTLGTAGVLGIAGQRNTSGLSGIAGVWGDAYAHVGVLGTSTEYAGVEGLSYGGPGIQGVSTQADGGDFTGGHASSGSPGIGVKGTGGDDSAGNGNGGGEGGVFYGGYGGGNSGGGGAGIEGYGGGSSASAAGPGVIGYGGQSNANTGTAGDGGDFFAYPSTNGIAGEGIYAQASTTDETGGYAGSFSGNVTIDGTLFADAKDFKIDHPSDPANKYLVHTSIESSEMVNVYSGNVVTDELGLATVQLPSWFETLNGDLRYQLTVVGRKAQAWVSQEVKDGKFQIASDATNTKVSWQITGVRQDAYAKAHPLVVEQTKNARERGFYKHPELYGQPAEKAIEWGRNPDLMRRAKATREGQEKRLKAVASNVKSTASAPNVNRGAVESIAETK